MLKALVIVAALAVPLSGCAWVEKQFSPDNATPEQILEKAESIVYAAKSAYSVVLTAAVAYESLPRCDEVEDQICSDRELVAKIRELDIKAANALDYAEQVVRTQDVFTDEEKIAAVAAAQAAIFNYTDLLRIHELLIPNGGN